MESIHDLYLQMQVLQAKINALHEPTQAPVLILIKPFQTEKELYRLKIRYDEPYFMITLTYHPVVSVNLIQEEQKIKLVRCFESFRKYQYFSCIESHKSGILHAHIMLQSASYHDIHTISIGLMKELKGKKENNIEPTINIKPIKYKIEDLDRSYDYIWDHKKDHPIYKYLQINI